jgi:Flp pilus assembly secretin CpaC
MRATRLFVAAFAAACMLVSPASARDIRVALDQAFPIRLAEPAEGVAVGNPAIAGVSVQNDQFLFVTGRSYGSTNLVVVGENGRVLYSGRIVVSPDETDVVMVTRGVETARLECTPLCRPRPDIGDGEASTSINAQITSRPAATSR